MHSSYQWLSNETRNASIYQYKTPFLQYSILGVERRFYIETKVQSLFTYFRSFFYGGILEIVD